MDLKKDNKTIGTMYINLQLNLSELPENALQIVAKAKAGELTLFLQDNVNCKIESYRKHYITREYLCFEGVNLKF